MAFLKPEAFRWLLKRVAPHANWTDPKKVDGIKVYFYMLIFNTELRSRCLNLSNKRGPKKIKIVFTGI